MQETPDFVEVQGGKSVSVTIDILKTGAAMIEELAIFARAAVGNALNSLAMPSADQPFPKDFDSRPAALDAGAAVGTTEYYLLQAKDLLPHDSDKIYRFLDAKRQLEMIEGILEKVWTHPGNFDASRMLHWVELQKNQKEKIAQRQAEVDQMLAAKVN